MFEPKLGEVVFFNEFTKIQIFVQKINTSPIIVRLPPGSERWHLALVGVEKSLVMFPQAMFEPKLISWRDTIML